MSERWQQASHAEGDVGQVLDSRLFGNMEGALEDAGNTPLLGRGIGMGSNFAAVSTTGDLGFMLGENEWQRVVAEFGPIAGLLFMGARVAFARLHRNAGVPRIETGSAPGVAIAARGSPVADSQSDGAADIPWIHGFRRGHLFGGSADWRAEYVCRSGDVWRTLRRGVPVKIVLVGNYLRDRQESMQRFTALMQGGLEQAGHEVKVVRPAEMVSRLSSGARGVAKWLGYVDKYVMFPPQFRAAVRVGGCGAYLRSLERHVFKLGWRHPVRGDLP